ncbi:MAG TPA: VOC family protein [Longimicrobiales bacterium]|nr:VOC family protein [Longimicrobiales bacterium]
MSSKLLFVLVFASAPVSAQESFNLRFDHSTVLVTDLEASAAFYEKILHLRPVETPWGSAAPIRFFSMGDARQLHMGLSDAPVATDKNVHLAFAITNFDEYLRFLTEQGITFGNFSGSSSDPQVRPDGIRQIYLQDPDGNWIEINDAAHFQ